MAWADTEAKFLIVRTLLGAAEAGFFPGMIYLMRSCKASAHVPEWRRLEEEAAKTPQPTPKPAPAAKKPAKRKATKPASPTDKSPKEAPAPKSAGTPEGIITTDKDSILS